MQRRSENNITLLYYLVCFVLSVSVCVCIYVCRYIMELYLLNEVRVYLIYDEIEFSQTKFSFLLLLRVHYIRKVLVGVLTFFNWQIFTLEIKFRKENIFEI